MISQTQEGQQNLKHLIESLQKSTIDGSAITMCLLPQKNMNEYRTMLASEIAQASNIKDKGNKQSVVQGLKSARQALKQYKKVPENGLIVISANVIFEQSRTYQKVLEVIEPHRPITKEIYSCGKNFNFTHIKEEILVNDSTFGYIIIDGNSILLAITKGSHREVLKEIKSDIMRGHNKGGQSSVRFARLRDQSRYNFVKAACEQSNKHFAMLKEEPQGYVVAGSANIKNDFIENEILAPFIKKKILKVIDIAQGSEQGLKLAISQSKGIITDSILLKEKEVLSKFFQDLNVSPETSTNGFRTVKEVLSIGLAELVIITKSVFSGQQFQEIENLCRQNGCQIVLVSDRSQQGQVFAKNYGGIGAKLRYAFDSDYLKEDFMEEQETMGMTEKEEFFL